MIYTTDKVCVVPTCGARIPAGTEMSRTGRCNGCKGVHRPRGTMSTKRVERMECMTVDGFTPWEKDVAAQAFVEEHPDGATLEEVAIALGLSRERVRQIEDEASRKLKAIIRHDPEVIATLPDFVDIDSTITGYSNPTGGMPRGERADPDESEEDELESEFTIEPWSEDGIALNGFITRLEAVAPTVAALITRLANTNEENDSMPPHPTFENPWTDEERALLEPFIVDANASMIQSARTLVSEGKITGRTEQAVAQRIRAERIKRNIVPTRASPGTGVGLTTDGKKPRRSGSKKMLPPTTIAGALSALVGMLEDMSPVGREVTMGVLEQLAAIDPAHLSTAVAIAGGLGSMSSEDRQRVVTAARIVLDIEK